MWKKSELTSLCFAADDPYNLLKTYSAPRNLIVERSRRKKREFYDLIAELSDDYPGRISGSEVLNESTAVGIIARVEYFSSTIQTTDAKVLNTMQWVEAKMAEQKLENVRRQETMVPHWKRNEEVHDAYLV